ncbi:hypothetical protein PFICI_03804 [Pestalotiopsis fici W106-1]|uniref:Uncharacterized protein n=1 Tax=Pestalotiopsis fici (strain W106-1 / CGMCC3.15140) TaxID=1229662 RepID=W3XIG1_PESFW|nr:uncharacterized protein PFICI_03804 [Pestalotiopsis fici W106-1]ETS85779.1 hypothetical protein PFICI_03804 [Pestalotiopsis fici W106-1]
MAAPPGVVSHESIKPLLLEALDNIEPQNATDQSGTGPPSEEDQNAAIVNLLKAWLSVAEAPSLQSRAFHYVLADEPLDGPLSLSLLQGRAQTITRRMMSICEDLEVDLFLATLVKETRRDSEDDPNDPYGSYGRGYYDEDEDEDEDNDEEQSEEEPHPKLGSPDKDEAEDADYDLERVFDIVSGNHLVTDTKTSEGEILQNVDTCFEGEPDEVLEDEYVYMGESTVTSYHRRPVLVIVPAKTTFDYLWSSTGGGHGANRVDKSTKLLEWYTMNCLSPSAKPWHLAAFKRALHEALCRWTERVCDDLAMQVFQVIMIHRLEDLRHRVITNSSVRKPASFFIWAANNIDQEQMQWSRFHGQQYEILTELSTASHINEELESIITSSVYEIFHHLEAETRGGKEEGKTYYEMALFYKDLGFIKNKLVTNPEKYAYSTAFMLEFLRSLRRGIKRTEVPRAEALDIYQALADRTILSMNLSTMSAGPTKSKKSTQGGNASEFSETNEYVDPGMLSAFIDSLNEYKFGGLLSNLLALFVRDTAAIPSQEYDQLYIPVLHGLISSFEKHKVPLAQPAVQAAFKSILGGYILKYVGQEPRIINWTRDLTKCTCYDCRSLNAFLGNPSRERGYFPLAQNRRDHLTDMLRSSKINCDLEVSRSGSPHTLIVTKKVKHKRESTDYWIKLRLRAEDKISTFDQEILKLLLEDQYDEITTMRKLTPIQSQTPAAYTSTYSQSLSHLSSPSAGLQTHAQGNGSPHATSPSLYEWRPRGVTRHGQIKDYLVPTTPGAPMTPTAPKPTVYPVFAFKSAPQRREALAPRSGNESDQQKLARLQDEIARAGCIPTPSEKRASAAKANSRYNTPQRPSASQPSWSSQKTPSTVGSTAGVKRKAEFVDLTLDSD